MPARLQNRNIFSKQLCTYAWESWTCQLPEQPRRQNLVKSTAIKLELKFEAWPGGEDASTDAAEHMHDMQDDAGR